MKFMTIYSKANAEFMNLLKTCDKCGFYDTRVEYIHLKQNYSWSFKIICNNCNNIIYKQS
jgi:hypothetical protein